MLSRFSVRRVTRVGVAGPQPSGTGAPSAKPAPGPSPAPERLRLLDRDELEPRVDKLFREHRALAGRAADDQPVDARPHEQLRLVGEQRLPADAHERLRQPPGRVTEALGLPACEDDRFHY